VSPKGFALPLVKSPVAGSLTLQLLLRVDNAFSFNTKSARAVAVTPEAVTGSDNAANFAAVPDAASVLDVLYLYPLFSAFASAAPKTASTKFAVLKPSMM
jgi:hypothetical protein